MARKSGVTMRQTDHGQPGNHVEIWELRRNKAAVEPDETFRINGTQRDVSASPFRNDRFSDKAG